MTKKQKFFTEQTDYLVCPHCGYEHSDWEGQAEPYFDCHNCEKEFAFSTETILLFTSETLEQHLDKLTRQLNWIESTKTDDLQYKFHEKSKKKLKQNIAEVEERINKSKEK
jgi:DNA-directed RNA polymerase subunit RPC12/RpoP